LSFWRRADMDWVQAVDDMPGPEFLAQVPHLG
jgi:hypothetical protein